ncbi:MAG: aminotransferase class I/II-fold pyridoxal phosphate-dependent enzyme [Thermoplasmata archaeon]|nr:aminotransferase class I/II-fold pyridoxal phosphate-dependent enzyme [Thermoplasmata archaeon]
MSDPSTTDPRPARKGPTFEPLPEWVGLSTRLVHGARRPDLNAGAVVPPIYQTSTYHYPAEFSEANGRGDVHLYTRGDNPTHEVAEELLRQSEGAEAAAVFASGMGAISGTLLTFLKAGDEVVVLDDLYGGTRRLFSDLLPGLGIRVRWVHTVRPDDPSGSVAGSPKIVFLETPSNPVLHVHDLEAWSSAADRAGALLVVDNTFATPVNQNPLAHGADLVVHSATKYLGGHSDLVAGAVVGPSELVDRVRVGTLNLGSTLDPFAAFLLARGMRTLSLRVARQNLNGERAVESLAAHPRVRRVDYPGRASAEEEAAARRQMRGRGGLLAVTVDGGSEGVRRFLHALRLVHVASSLGGVESLASSPSETSHRHLSADERSRLGIEPGTVRLALGIEEPDDLVRDLTEALDQLS